MTIINTHEAKTHLSQLLDRAANGEEIIIARAGKPIARLTALRDDYKNRTGGQWKGLISMSEDFDEPLPDEILAAFLTKLP